MRDTIYRDDAIEAVKKHLNGKAYWGTILEVENAISALQSAEAPKPTVDLISRADAIEKIKESLKWIDDNMAQDDAENEAHDIGFYGALISMERMINELPSAKTEPSLKAIKRQIDEHWYLDPPSAEAVQGWTPCSEGLPEIDETLRICDQISEEVLGTDTYGNIRHVYLTNCGYLKPTFCTVEEGMSVDIVAWMPLPKPYKGGDTE